MTRDDQLKLMSQLLNAALETVNQAGPQGAPAGPMYAAFMGVGVSLEFFNAMMAALVKGGKVTKRGDCYYPVERAKPAPITGGGMYPKYNPNERY
jgi:hypothetical protein